jgi:hypothetical protein
MIIHRLPSGGFVIHNGFGQRVTAWFDSDGKLLDCTRFDSLGRSRKPSKAIVKRLISFGPKLI